MTIAGLMVAIAGAAFICSRYGPLSEERAVRAATSFMVKLWPDSKMEQCETRIAPLAGEPCWKVEFREPEREWCDFYVEVFRDGHCKYVSTFTCAVPAM
jgi:hypothetical protein